MNQDKSISKMFKEKNKEIFINSLTLEMERNLESLKNTTDNCVSLEINKLFLFFKSFFQENSIAFKKEELLGLLYKERKVLNDIVNSKIEDKKQNIKNNFLEKDDKEDVLTEEFLNSYYEELKEETDKLNSELELLIKEEIVTNFSQSIIKKYQLSDIEQLERINSRVNILFNNNIVSKIMEQTKFRDESLSNMAKESFNKYVELNKNTIE